MAKGDKLDIRNAKRTAGAMKVKTLRVENSGATAANKRSKASVKAGKSATGIKVTSSGYKTTKTNSAKMPSVAAKTGVKNKMKAQGAKMGSSATSGYGKTTKK
jgi:hypothetical protein